MGSTGCTASLPVTVNPLPSTNTVTVTNGGNYCAGAPGVNIGLSGSTTGVNYDLYTGSSYLSTMAGMSSALDYGLFTNTSGSPMVYTIVATNPTTGCTSNMAGSATVYPANPLPTAYMVMGGGANCSGGTGVDIYTSGSDLGVKYQLYNGTATVGTPINGTGTPMLDFGLHATNGTYTVVAITTTTGCTNNLLSNAVVTTNPAIATYPVTGGGNFCTGGAGSDVTLSNSTAGINYQLFNGTTAIASVLSTSGPIDFGNQPVGVYTVVGSIPGTSCTQNMTGSATIGTFPLPTVYAVTGGGNYCAGSTGSHVGVAYSATGVNYQLFNDGIMVATVPGSYSGVDFGAQTDTGTYTVVAVNAATSCSSNMSGSTTIYVNPLPTSYTVSTGGSFCAGGTGVDVNLGGSDMGVQYQLYNGGTAVGLPMTASGGSMVDFGFVTNPGTYTIVAKNPSTTCTAIQTGSSVITVNAIPVAYNLTGGGNYCAGGTGSPLMLANSQAGVTYQVYLDGSMVPGASVTGTGSALALGSFTGTGTYTVQGMNGSCTNNMNGSKIIGTNPLPALYSVTGGGNYCMGGTGRHISLSLTNSDINYQLLVSGTPTGAAVTGTGFTYDFGAKTVAGNYQVVATNPLTGCQDTMSGSATIGVNMLPAVYNVINGGGYCTGGTGVNVSLNNSAPGVNYVFLRGTTAAGSALGNGTMLNVLETAAGTYTAIGTDTLTGCTANMSGSTTVTINSLPGMAAVTGGGNYCAGSVTGVPVSLASSVSGIEYVLLFGSFPVDSLSGTGGALSFPSMTGAGSYTVLARNTTTGCTNTMSGTATIGITPNVTPSVMVSTGMGDSVCSGSMVTFTATPVNGGTAPAYQWQVNGHPVVSTGATYSYMPVTGDVVTATLTSNAVCPLPATASNTQTITVFSTETPSVSISATGGNTVCPGTMVTLSSSPVFGGTSPSYNWLVNGHPASTAATYSYTPANTDVVSLVLTSNYPCRTATTVNSNDVVFDVNAPVTPVFSVYADPGTVISKYQTVYFYANVTNASTGATFTWKVNGTTVSSTPTYSTATLVNNDTVSLTITSSAGTCGTASTTQSLIVSVSDLGVKGLTGNAANILVVPNPNNGSFTVKGSLAVAADQQVSFDITNMLGQVVYTGQALAKNGVINENIQLGNNMANGMYILNVHTNEGNSAFHFVIGQ